MTGLTTTDGPVDPFAAARAVADAVLYEGYVLYPYRSSAPKNRMRWQFGVLAPPESVAGDPSERSSARTECLVAPDAPIAAAAAADAAHAPLRLAVRVRCLQLRQRSIEALGDIDSLDLIDEPLIPWDETIEQTVDLELAGVLPAATATRVQTFRFALVDEPEIVHSPEGEAIARLVRRRQPVEGRLSVAVEPAGGGLVKVIVEVANRTPWPGAAGAGRQEMLRRSLVAAHTMLAVEGGRFVSLLDPPEEAVAVAAACRNEGTFPVLVGADDRVVLSSPITLYDHPAVAEESLAVLGDATEVGEILALLRGGRSVPPSPLSSPLPSSSSSYGTFGAKLPVQAIADIPWWEPEADTVDPVHDSLVVAGVEPARGSQVRLHPNRQADAQDLLLAGEVATVAAIVDDIDGGRHVAVTLDVDPAADLHREQGRHLYFSPDEVEPLPGGARTRPRRVLVAGIGNVLLGDDAFGVEVAQRLAGRELPEGVRAADFGIRGIALADEMLDGYDALILLDAMQLDEPPGTLTVVAPEKVGTSPDEPGAPTIHPGVVLGLLETFDVKVERIVIIGCQPEAFDGTGLSEPVAEAVGLAVDLLEDVLTDVCAPLSEVGT